MTAAEATDFLRPAVFADAPEIWADLGCGGGTFTRALSELSPTGSQIFAVDQQKQSLANFIKADFVNDELDIKVDGILMANSFHYVADKLKLVSKLEKLFISDPKFILIEYDTQRNNRSVPYPIPFGHLSSVFKDYQITKVAERPSAYGGKMYCAVLTRD